MSEHLDIFNNDAFSLMSMSIPLSETPYVPGMVSELVKFDVDRVRTETVSLESRDKTVRVIKSQQRGGDTVYRPRDRRKMRDFPSIRIRETDVIKASEVANVRKFASNELQSVQELVADSIMDLRVDVEATKELHRLGMIQGKWLDADGSEIINFFDEFGVAEPSLIDWSSTAENSLNQSVRDLSRSMLSSLGGLTTLGGEIVGMAGDNFYDRITQHADWKEQFKGTNQAPTRLLNTTIWNETVIGGNGNAQVRLINYRGNTALNANLTIPTNEVRFFFRGINGLFQEIYTPGEKMSQVQQKGLPIYADVLPDLKRNEFVEPEASSYPLFICSRPATLRKATITP